MRSAPTIAVALLLIAADIAASPLSATEIPQGERRSDYSLMTPDTQAIQDDDTANPGMLWVLDGEALWKSKAGAAGKACADCHDDARASMKGVAAHYPAFDKTLGRPVNLEQRINFCRVQNQQATPLAYESRDLLALTAFVAQQSRGAAISPMSIRNSSHSSPGDVSCSCSGRASSILAVPIAMTTIGTSGLRGLPSRKDTRPAIRFTGWSGNRSARCSAACAAASAAYAPRLMTTARLNWSSWSFT